ncbi:MAG: peptidylprolyl isomerase [Phycisphaerales bacterium]|nr:peptidylprolyl isomerase [Phycisphaerales bacterium]
MLRKIVRRFRFSATTRAGQSVIEPMEPRQLLAAAPTITNVVADNRGEVLLTASRFLRNVNKNSVKFFTAGADGAIGTADDVRKTDITVSFNPDNNRITIRGRTDPNATYRVRLESSLITAGDGKRLDGEFSGTFPTGNGTQGGNFSFLARRDRSNMPVVRMSTNLGTMTIRIRKDVAPVSATQFLDLANGGFYDNMIFARAVPNFVLQAGSLQVTGSGTSASDVIGNTAPSFPQELPRVLSNLRGTLSFARGGPQALASNQFFINIGNNDASSAFNNLDEADFPGDAVFTPFAQVIDGLAVADAIVNKPTADLSAQLSQAASNGSVAVTNVPVNNPAQAQTSLNPNRDLMIARRTAVRMKIAPAA